MGYIDDGESKGFFFGGEVVNTQVGNIICDVLVVCIRADENLMKMDFKCD